MTARIMCFFCFWIYQKICIFKKVTASFVALRWVSKKCQPRPAYSKKDSLNCISKWSDIPKSNFVMTFAGRLRRAPLTECFKNEICFTWVPNSGPKIFFIDESRFFFRTGHLAIGPWLVLTSFSTDYCLTYQMRSKQVMDQSEMSCVKKKYRLWMKKKIFDP